MDNRIVREPPLILASLVDDNRLMLIKELNLYCYLIHSAMLVPG